MTYWVNQYGICDAPHPNNDEGKWRFPQGTTAIRRFIRSSGVITYELVCTIPGCRYKTSPIPNRAAEDLIRRGRLTQIADRRSDYPTTTCCYTTCTSTEVEWHHFAPRNTFGYPIADNYPVMPLCRTHHRYWHQTMDGYRWHKKCEALAAW